MAYKNANATRKFKATINCPNAAWSTPVEVTGLAGSGLLARSVLRAPSGTSSTAADIMVWEGGLTDDADISDPSTEVPEEDRVLDRTAITIAGSATAADDDYNILADKVGAPYDARDEYTTTLWCSIKSTGAETAMVWTLFATDTL